MAVGLDLGPEEGLSAICRHGRGQDGFSVGEEGSDEASVDGYGVTHTVLGSVLGFHGFRDGGGHIHSIDMGCHMEVMDGPMRLPVGVTDSHGALICIPMLPIHTCILRCHTWDTGEELIENGMAKKE